MKEKGLQGSRTTKISLRHNYYLTTNQDKCSSYYKEWPYDILLFHYQYIANEYTCSKINP